MTSQQILAGAGLSIVLAVGSQVLAARLRLPAIILLLPVGFTAGALVPQVRPSNLIGPSFAPMVSLAVAVILYDAGLELDLRRLTGPLRRIVVRLVTVGTLVTWIGAALAAAPCWTCPGTPPRCWGRSWWSPGPRWSVRCWRSCGPSGG
ncbi:cation:proton antiporter [Streptacidiphilus monticola]